MYRRIAHVTIVVKEYDEAIQYYTDQLNFELIEDTPLTETKRWVVVAPKGARECSILLAKADGDKQVASIGNQTGGRVGLFLFTDDFWRDYTQMSEKGVNFIRSPRKEVYGTVAVFSDLYGNLWDLLEPNSKNKGLL